MLKPAPVTLLVRSEPEGGRTCQSIPDTGQEKDPQKCLIISSLTGFYFQTIMRLDKHAMILAFLHLGVGDEHLSQVFEHARPAERAVGHGGAGHLRDGAHAEQLVLWVAGEGAQQLT